MELQVYDLLMLTVVSFLSRVETTVLDNGNGSYNISYTPKEPGVYSVWVCVKDQHVKVQLLPGIHHFLVTL